MARIANNVLTRGFRGMFGTDIVFKTMRGKTFVSPPARKPDKKKESEAQRNTRSTFRDATHWAQHILEDPERKAYYQKRARVLKLPNAYTAAITDYMRKARAKKSQLRETVTCMVNKPGFTLKKVRVVTSDPAVRNIKIWRTPDSWKVQYAADPAASPPLSIVVTDDADREQWIQV